MSTDDHTAPGTTPVTAGVSDPLLNAATVPEEPVFTETGTLIVRERVSRAFIALLALGLFGTYLAFVTPIAISLALRVNVLAPENPEYLGLLLGIGSLAALLVGPLGGQLSDRTRSRFGRRRPWLIGGVLLGLVGLTVMALGPNVLVLGLGWIIAQIGLGQAANLFTTIQADKLPESQRGRVAAITGFVTMVAPVVGAVVGGRFATQPFLLFLVPGAVALVFVFVFVLFYKDADSRSLTFDGPLSVKGVLSGYVFNPKRYPDFAWNWLGRFLFFFGLTLNTTYTAYFFAQRLDIPVIEIGDTVATVGLIGILGTIVGVFAGGFLSDRLRRRKPFVLGSAILFGIGAIVMVLAPDFTLLIIGSLLTNLSIGVFSAVDQALFLDVLPERDTEAGRFVNITQFATTIPQALAPLVASGVLTLIATEGGPNYSVLYVAAAVLVVIGGFVILRVKSVR
ncbi:MFS transporter [Microbacterium sp. CFBP9023]|uniref:MFS transporter n=1 Tax=Microbacterium sp. CFBP9023 TaxID=3096535 RepID=UPI002A6B1BE9|nr:MFS transporter [Microbacterium sp. CFBP9023]MDY0983594.1 MFS transporter [Microbacterium sp. CFBP9023]